MKKLCIIMYGLALGMSNQLHACLTVHAVFQSGAYVSSPGVAQHVGISGLIGDEFSVTSGNDVNALVGLSYFLDGQHWAKTQLSYGISAYYLPQTSASGTITQEDLFTNLSYEYSVAHFPLYAAARSLTQLSDSRLSLIMDAGVGPNFMRTRGFSERSLDGGITIPDMAFSGHISTTLSATASIGLQLDNLFGKMPLACAYRFFYLGEGELSKKNNQLLDNLRTGTVYANAVTCSIQM